MSRIKTANIEAFAKKYRLTIERDACDDQVIYGYSPIGERQLYFDGDALCLMAIDAPLVQKSRWEALGGKLWLGEIARDGSRKIQDVKITGIPLEHARAAIRLAHARLRPKLTEEQRAALRERFAANAALSGKDAI